MNRRHFGLLEASGQLITLTVFTVGILENRLVWAPQTSPLLRVVGGVLVAAGFALTGWAMGANPHFSAAMSLSQRGHRLVRSGPYRFVRHPGYAGFIASWLGAPLLLGSLWALVPSLLGSLLTVWRTSVEDSILQEELPGYADYAESVGFRLIPCVWQRGLRSRDSPGPLHWRSEK